MDQNEKIKELQDYQASLKEKTLEELQKMEQEVMNEADEVNKEVSNKKFDMPEEGYKYVAEAVRSLLDKKSIQWQFTLTLATMYEWWDPDHKPDQIEYPLLDSTLRTLGEMTFEGYKEWAAVVAINKYFEPIRDEYINVTEKVYDVASKHNAIVDEINKKTPIGNVKDNAKSTTSNGVAETKSTGE